MSKASTNEFVPEIRFPEFRGHWIQKTLGESFEERSEKNRSDLPLLSLGENGLVYQSETARKDNSNADKSKYLRVAVGDIAYNTMRMWQGRCVCAGIEGIVSPAYTVCKPKEGVDSLFHYYLFKTQRMIQVFHQNSQGLVSDTLNLKYDSFSKIKYLIPPTLAEQEKIAQFLSEADEMISAQEQKVESLKAHKKGLMQQLFPQPSATTPDLRFPGFSGNWEKKKFKDITVPAGKKNRQNIPYERYSISNEDGFYPQSSQFEDGGGYLKDIDCRQYIIVPPKSFAYNPARINVGSIGYQDLSKDVIVSSLYEVFQTKDGIDDTFLWQWFHTDIFRRMVINVQEGGVRQYFFYEKLRECSINLPTLSEQKIIAACLEAEDQMIAAQEQKVESLKIHKKGLMQQLFPQPVK